MKYKIKNNENVHPSLRDLIITDYDDDPSLDYIVARLYNHTPGYITVLEIDRNKLIKMAR